MTVSATNQGLKPGVCTSSNRPVNPYDGMMIYETDTNLVRIWNGSAWKTLAYSDYTSGSVMQVQSTTKTNWFSTTSTSFTDVTGMSVSITPSSASSKVLVIVNAFIGVSTSAYGVVQILRDATPIYAGTESVAILGNTWINSNALDPRVINDSTSVHLDSPATTSATTYKLQMRASSGATVYLNRTGHASDNSMASSITVMEVAG